MGIFWGTFQLVQMTIDMFEEPIESEIVIVINNS